MRSKSELFLQREPLDIDVAWRTFVGEFGVMGRREKRSLFPNPALIEVSSPTGAAEDDDDVLA